MRRIGLISTLTFVLTAATAVASEGRLFACQIADIYIVGMDGTLRALGADEYGEADTTVFFDEATGHVGLGLGPVLRVVKTDSANLIRAVLVEEKPFGTNIYSWELDREYGHWVFSYKLNGYTYSGRCEAAAR